MRVGFIGAGKVGFSLGRFLLEKGIHVTGYYSRHVETAREAATFTNSECFELPEYLVKKSDVIFLTVPDGEILPVYRQIIQYDIENKQICHCSGSLTVKECFPAIDEHRAFGYSIHPLFPVSNKLTSFGELSDAFFCLEGQGPHLKFWMDFFRQYGNGVKHIDGSVKSKYHAACAIASNLYCALFYESLELLGECGFTETEGIEALSPLVRSNVSHLLEEGPVSALTGPVERGDVNTVIKHQNAISKCSDKQMYFAVSKKLLEIAKIKNPSKDYCDLEILLNPKF